MTQASSTSQRTGATLSDEIRAFLAAPRFATIATLDPDGGPHQAVIWYALDGDSLIVNSRVERRWPRNLDRDGRVAVAVYETEAPYHWVGLEGRAERLHDGEAATLDIEALARRYGRDPERYRGQARVSFRISIDSAFDYRS